MIARQDLKHPHIKCLQSVLPKIGNLCMLELPFVVIFALYFGDINKGDSDRSKIIFN
jgi:hypothetical protein